MATEYFPRWGAVHSATATTRSAVYSILFGDRLGATLFLGTLAFVALYWRPGIFITDNYTIANTLVGVADGHLHIDRIVYGPGPDTPGMHTVDGRLYGRNYGHVALALPFLWLLQGLAAVADLRIAIAGLWALVILGFAVNLGRLFDRPRLGSLLGSIVALGAFTVNVALASPLSSRWIYLMALQLSTMVAAAFIAVMLYRLSTRLYDRTAGVTAGAAAIIATPLGFWAVFPKRHIITALLLTLAIYTFYRSRTGTDETRYRALTYAWVGLLAWIHAPEALAVFLALVVVDFPTATNNDIRSLGIVGGVFFVSLLPFFLTNQLVVGNPLEPPRLWPTYNGQGDVLGITDGSATGGNGAHPGGSTGGDSFYLVPPGIITLVTTAVGKVTLFTSLFTRGVDVAVSHPDRLYQTFVRSGYISSVAARDGGEAINLTLLESMPILAAGLAIIGSLTHQFPDRETCRQWVTSPRGQTDLFVGVSTVLFALIYLPRLPVHAMVTVRYLVPIIPGLMYLLLRLAPLRRALARQWTLGGAYTATVLLGGQLFVLGLALTNAELGEAVQFHALVGITTAMVLGGWAFHDAVRRPWPRLGAVCLGLAAGVTTIFLLLSGIHYFAYAGDFALPVIQRLGDAFAHLPSAGG